MVDKVKWSKEKPTEAGYYVCRHGVFPWPYVCEITERDKELFIRFDIKKGQHKLERIADREWLKVM